jgi:HD-GYP domain-containing protein (c-di-GMP phosphodiesterase class II)
MNYLYTMTQGGEFVRDEKTGKTEPPANDPILRYPVHALDNQQLLPAGTVLTEETMHALASSLKDNRGTEQCSLLSHDATEKHILTFFKTPPYHTIFADRELVGEILQLMNHIHIAPPLLQSLDYFKKYDFYTYRHILMVSALTTLLAKDLVADYKDQIREMATGPTHDVGKLSIPLHVLKKSSPLTRTERNILQHHTLTGYVLLSYYCRDPLNLAAQVARDHHERRNGSGYPCGKLLKDFMIEIIACCDIYDALISPRPYRPVSYDNRTALEEITAIAERDEISRDIVRALIALNRGGRRNFREIELSHEKRGAPPPGNVYGMTSDTNDEKT